MTVEEMQAKKEKLQSVWKKRPMIIAGPCSAETEEQVLETAKGLASTGKIDVFRAGIWKPRTRPGSFEGIGAQGLPWLQRVKKETGMLTAVEIATPKQVENALHFGVDILWIGGRTTVNPFSVQDIADALRGVEGVPVLIKNPLNPDLELWTGAVERIARAGIHDIGLIHRGFATYGSDEYRNPPMWHLAIDMKMRYPELPFIIDPSHICGNRQGLLEIAQKAVDLDYDGVIIESHCNPDKAWSDAKQQVTPQALNDMLQSIVWRKEDKENIDHAALANFRQQINNLDDELIQLLAKRMKVVENIGQYKKDNGITILQSNRWNDILEKAIAQGKKYGLSKAFVTQYFDAIHMESIAHQNAIMND